MLGKALFVLRKEFKLVSFKVTSRPALVASSMGILKACSCAFFIRLDVMFPSVSVLVKSFLAIHCFSVLGFTKEAFDYWCRLEMAPLS